MVIHHISDTHGYHDSLQIRDCDVIIHSGDFTNSHNPATNFNEAITFLLWYSKLDIPYKILIAGNHDASLFKKLINKVDLENMSIIYLEMDSVIINGIKFYGIPYTPTFGQWYFTKDRGKLSPLYENIEEDTNVLISHGPPKGVLDLTFKINGELEMCGCVELSNRIKKLPNLLLNLYGHIHDCNGVRNNGVVFRDRIFYSNAALVFDGKFDKRLVHNGNLFEIDEKQKIVNPI